MQGLLVPFLLIKADQCSEAFPCKCRLHTQRDVYCRWHRIFRPLSLTLKTWGRRELLKCMYLWRLSLQDNEHFYGNGRLNGRDSSQLFLHELENKMLHLHEMFFWLMAVIEELLQATGSVIVSLFVTRISVLRSKGSAWWRLKLLPFTALLLLYIAHSV